MLGNPLYAHAATVCPPAQKVVAVGTLNEGKHDAVRTAVKRWRSEYDLKMIGVKVSSGVAEQPVGLDETCKGAQNRAVAAHRDTEGAWIGNANTPSPIVVVV